MMNSFADMASSIASALKPSANESASMYQPLNPSSPKPGTSSTHSSVGISPGRKIDLQEKLLNQVDLLHKMFERGAITTNQFELRRDSVMKQLQSLDCD